MSLVLGYLYGGTIDWELENLMPVLAAAKFFQFEDLIDKCADNMRRTLDIENVVSYYNMAMAYGMNSVKSLAVQWLETNIFSLKIRDDYQFLRQVTPELFGSILRSPDLIPPNAEFIVYDTLKRW